MSLSFRRNREPRFRFEGASGAGQPATGPLDRLRARGPQPDTFPALTDPRDTGPMQRMPRLSRVQQRPRPDRPYDAALFTWSDLIEQFIMLCGTCPPERRNRYADPVAGHMPHSFEALRVSAYEAGWRLDRFARWACPACQRTPAYWAPYRLAHSHPDVRRLWRAGGLAVREDVAPIAQAALDYDPRPEREHGAEAEHDLIRDVHDAARRYRHAPKAGTS